MSIPKIHASEDARAKKHKERSGAKKGKKDFTEPQTEQSKSAPAICNCALCVNAVTHTPLKAGNEERKEGFRVTRLHAQLAYVY